MTGREAQDKCRTEDKGLPCGFLSKGTKCSAVLILLLIALVLAALVLLLIAVILAALVLIALVLVVFTAVLHEGTPPFAANAYRRYSVRKGIKYAQIF